MYDAYIVMMPQRVKKKCCKRSYVEVNLNVPLNLFPFMDFVWCDTICVFFLVQF